MQSYCGFQIILSVSTVQSRNCRLLKLSFSLYIIIQEKNIHCTKNGVSNSPGLVVFLIIELVYSVLHMLDEQLKFLWETFLWNFFKEIQITEVLQVMNILGWGWFGGYLENGQCVIVTAFPMVCPITGCVAPILMLILNTQ